MTSHGANPHKANTVARQQARAASRGASPRISKDSRRSFLYGETPLEVVHEIGRPAYGSSVNKVNRLLRTEFARLDPDMTNAGVSYIGRGVLNLALKRTLSPRDREENVVEDLIASRHIHGGVALQAFEGVQVSRYFSGKKAGVPAVYAKLVDPTTEAYDTGSVMAGEFTAARTHFRLDTSTDAPFGGKLLLATFEASAAQRIPAILRKLASDGPHSFNLAPIGLI